MFEIIMNCLLFLQKEKDHDRMNVEQIFIFGGTAIKHGPKFWVAVQFWPEHSAILIGSHDSSKKLEITSNQIFIIILKTIYE